MTTASTTESSATPHGLVDLAARLAEVIEIRESDRLEVSLRSSGPSGALVYCERDHPSDIIAAVRALGGAPIANVLVAIAQRVPARRCALKIDMRGALSLFYAIDYSYADLATLCGPFGLGTDAAALARMAEELCLHLSGWAVEGDATGSWFRIRTYAMAEPHRTNLPADLARRTSQVKAAPQMAAAWMRWTGSAQVIVNLGLRAGRPPAVKFEFPEIDLSDLDGPPGWATQVRELTDRLGTTSLSHLGIRWQDLRSEHCAYLDVRPAPIHSPRRAP